ncbi:acylphosphatase [Salicibibacter halophilus]|uniref:acylphosphatase n=1 Tax=Salicibibacter halophilus TaxID=2502791 RepID=UPI00386F1112
MHLMFDKRPLEVMQQRGNTSGAPHLPQGRQHMMKSIYAVVYGAVQGVGFRSFVHEQAEKNHLYGWVRNREKWCSGTRCRRRRDNR